MKSRRKLINIINLKEFNGANYVSFNPYLDLVSFNIDYRVILALIILTIVYFSMGLPDDDSG